MTTQATRQELQNEITVAHYRARQAALEAQRARERAEICVAHFQTLVREYKQLFPRSNLENQ